MNFNRVLQLNIFDEIIFLLFLLIPIALITGPAIPDIILSTIALLYLIKIILNKNSKYFQNYFTIFFLLFCLFLIVRNFFSSLPLGLALEHGAIFYFRYLFFCLAVVYILNKKKNKLHYLAIIIFLSSIFISIDGIFQSFTGFNLFEIKKAEGARVSGFFGKEAILGRYLTYQVIILLILTLNIELSKYLKLIFFTLLPIIFVTIIIAGDRTPIVQIILFISALLLLNCKNKTYFNYTILIIFLFSTFVVFKFDIVKTRLISQTLEIIFSGNFGYDYLILYKTSLNIGLDNIFFGKGVNTFEIYCTDEKFMILSVNCSHPHNFLLQIFSETGLIGVSFFLFFYTFLFFVLVKNYLNKSKSLNLSKNLFNQQSSTIALIIILLPILPQMNFYNNWNNIFLFNLISFYLFFNRRYFNLAKFL